MLYATPGIGGVISNKLAKDTTSSFESKQGFVSGLSGEAEGLKFWTHWGGTGLEETGNKISVEKLKKLSATIQQVKTKLGLPFLSGYLGHVFCIEQIRAAFPNSIFIHLRRDLLSNCYSIYKASPNQWMSTRPAVCAAENIADMPRHQVVVKQVLAIHEIIAKASNPQDTIVISYEGLCDNPHLIVDQIIDLAQGNKLNLERSDKLNKNFTARIIDPNKNEDTKKIADYIEEALGKSPELKKILQWT